MAQLTTQKSELQNDEFCNIVTRAQCYITFYGHKLLIFVINQSVLSLASFASVALQTL
jgi:hypothetical protein